MCDLKRQQHIRLIKGNFSRRRNRSYLSAAVDAVDGGVVAVVTLMVAKVDKGDLLIRNGHSGPQSTVCPWYITSSDLNSNQVQLFFRNGRQATKGIGMAIWPQKK